MPERTGMRRLEKPCEGNDRRLLNSTALDVMRGALILAAGIAIVAGTITACGPSKQSAIDTAVEWARLAPLPVSAREVVVETAGSPLTREFTLFFQLSASQLEQWLRDCEGISDAEVFPEGEITRYAIHPGGGAQFAEVRVNQATGEVIVRTYWS